MCVPITDKDMEEVRNFKNWYRPRISAEDCSDDLFLTEQGHRMSDDALSR
jgi:hypothetical protein